MQSQITVGEVTVDVVHKDIKNVHLSVHPPTGQVTISAPVHMNLETVRLFAIARVGWIRQQQDKLNQQDRETPREFVNRESHYVWGERYLMKVIEAEAPPAIELKHSRMVFQIRPGTDTDKKKELLDGWYRAQVRESIQPLLATWEQRIGVKASGVSVRRMKTKWGSCNPTAKTILLNTDLAKKPRECLEYIVVHELVHLVEPTHNERFTTQMDQHMPKWRSHRQLLNSLPVRHENWGY
jgi:predicted metal-dependent hydrolase